MSRNEIKRYEAITVNKLFVKLRRISKAEVTELSPNDGHFCDNQYDQIVICWN